MAILIVSAVVFVVFLFSTAVWECNSTANTLVERELENGDWIKIRMEPDCSPTGGPRIKLYSKLAAEVKYRSLAYWRGDSAYGVMTYMDAPTPFILTPSFDHVLIRSPEVWHSFTLKDIANSALPDDLPLLTWQPSLTGDHAYDSTTHTLTIRAPWGGLYYDVRLKVEEGATFSFEEISLAPGSKEQIDSLTMMRPFEAAFDWTSQPSLRIRAIQGHLYAPTGTRTIATLPVLCDSDYPLSCAQTRVHVIHRATDTTNVTRKDIDLIATTWLVEPRRYETYLHVVHDEKVQNLNLSAVVQNFARNNDIEIASTEFHATYRERERDQIFIDVFVSPAPLTARPLFSPNASMPIPQHITERSCKRYTVKLEIKLETDSLPNVDVVSARRSPGRSLHCTEIRIAD